MKDRFPVLLLFSFLLTTLLFSCESDPDPLPDSSGSLVSDSGSCSETLISGSYLSEKALDESHFVTIRVEVTETGRYNISTEELNGYSFSGTGTFTATGIQSVVLKGSGTPQQSQTDLFHIHYGDSAGCSFGVRVGNPVPDDMSNRILITSGEPFMSDYSYTYAFDGNGKKLWSRVGYSSTATIENDIVYFTSGSKVYAVDIHTGEDIWTSGTSEGSFGNAVVLADDVIYTTASNGKIYALSAANGHIQWSYETGIYAVVSSSPTTADDVVYFGAPDDYIYALNKNGSLKWKYLTDASVRSSPAVADSKVYASADNGTLYALDAETGSLLWDFQAGTTGEESPTVSNGMVYIQGNLKVYCLDADTGSKVWEYEFPREADWSSPVEDNGTLYVCGTTEGLMAFDAASGAVLWNNTSSGSSNTNPPTVFEGIVYVTGAGGISAINTSSGETLWNYGYLDPWDDANSVSFYSSAVVYDMETKKTGYPSISGHKQ